MSEEQQDICIDAEYGDRLRINVLRRSCPDCDDYWDGNLVDSEVTIKAGKFEGSFHAFLSTTDFERFSRELIELSRTLSGKATFSTIEEQLSFTMEGDGLGHIQVSGQAMDVVGTGNRLEFWLKMDQTFLPPILKSVSAVLKKFPVIRQTDI